MENIIEILKLITEKGIVPVISAIVQFLMKLLGFTEKVYDDVQEKKEKEEDKRRDDHVKDVCDNGSLQDLFDISEDDE